ncbi:hypothetical protein [Methyloceanibacter marginalis]|uniref:hypothetical protein n=1 Tax=Methyloceanibacter marginalis TaxID=1774971 RepID=UPI0013014D33|nr:hypothetical protein [Methyloceanibacter marginalis]
MRYQVLRQPLDPDEDILDAEFIEVEDLSLEEIFDLICSEGRFPKTNGALH